jgi:hypothetical protein
MNREKKLSQRLNDLAGQTPDDVATHRALARAKSALVSSPQLSLRVQLMRPRNLAAIAAAIAIAIVLAQLLPSNGGGNFAFAQVQEQVEKAKTLQYLMTIKSKGTEGDGKRAKVPDEPGIIRFPDESTSSLRVMVLGTDQMREEFSSSHSKRKEFQEKGIASHYVHITNFSNRKEIFVYPENKTYSILVNAPSPKIGESDRTTAPTSASNLSNQKTAPDLYSLLRIPDASTKQLPERTVDGKKVVGFYVEKATEGAHGKSVDKITYWVEPISRHPVRIERNFSGPEVGSRRIAEGKWEDTVGRTESEIVISEIIFDAPLDSVLFSTDPPEGFTDRATKKSAENPKPNSK